MCVYSIYSMYIYWSVIIQAALGLNYLDLWQVHMHLSMLASAVVSWVWVGVFVSVIVPCSSSAQTVGTG